MTILFFCRFFYPHIGGVEKHVFEVGRRLAKKGHRITIITETSKDSYQSEFSSDKDMGRLHALKIVRIGPFEDNWSKKFKIWKSLWRKKSLIKKSDVVHLHDVFFWYLPFRFIYPRKKVYTTFHGFETRFPPSKKAVMVRKLSEELSLGNVIVGDYIKKWYGTKPTYITYGAVDKIQNFPPKADQPRAEKLKILFIGRLEEDTGIPTFLKTLEILKKKGIKFEFEAIGDGSFRGDAEKLGKVHGFVKNVVPYTFKSDIVFASSYLSMITALSLRKPVFSIYDNPLKRDYLKMTPFSKYITIRNSPKLLADEVKSVGRSKSIRNKTNLGYEWVKKQTWDKVVNLYIKLWGI